VGWEHVAASYDRVADVYETRFADELAAKPADRGLLAAFAATAADVVVDIGCGPGHIGAFVRARGLRVMGADLSPAMARVASTRLDAAVVADMRALPFRDGSLGGAVAFYSLIHVRRTELTPVLQEVLRVLRPGAPILLSAHEGTGEVIADDFLGQQVAVTATLVTLDEIAAAVSDAGFEVTASRRRAPYANEGSTTRLYLAARRPVLA
jgi:ubiquinone/menaquinone biosynthesis C-methylase UbiE